MSVARVSLVPQLLPAVGPASLVEEVAVGSWGALKSTGSKGWRGITCSEECSNAKVVESTGSKGSEESSDAVEITGCKGWRTCSKESSGATTCLVGFSDASARVPASGDGSEDSGPSVGAGGAEAEAGGGEDSDERGGEDDEGPLAPATDSSNCLFNHSVASDVVSL